MATEQEINTKAILAPVLLAICREVERACKKHNSWTTDPIHAAGIVLEEAGELMQAANDFNYEPLQVQNSGKHLRKMEEEAVQTAATCIRFLANLRGYMPTQKPVPDALNFDFLGEVRNG
jgi:acyl-CoA reductase-like NAD-dependent aldehyde dehydrogenase